MGDERALETAVAAVEDPLLHRTLGELGMVGDVVPRRLGADRIEILVPVPNHPLLAELDRRVTDALAPVTSNAEVTMEVMSDEARQELMASLRASAGPGVAEAGSRTRVVAISSGKGGVGKSSVTANLAVALARKGHGVGLLDADIWGFSIPRMLGIDHAPVVIEQSIVPPEANGVKVMSMDYFVGEDKAVIWRGPMLHKAIEQFLKDVEWGELDYLLVDMPPGTGDVSISLSQFLPRAQVLLVTTPQPTAQRVARRAALMARKVDQEVIGVVENMSWFTGDDGKRYLLFGAGGGAELAERLGVPLLGQVPLTVELREGADSGNPLVATDPESEAGSIFAAMAERIDVELAPTRRYHKDLKLL